MITGTLSLSYRNAVDKSYTENLGTIQADDIVDEAKKAEFAQQLDQFGRAVSALTTNTFSDMTVKLSFSINEILAEG